MRPGGRSVTSRQASGCRTSQTGRIRLWPARPRTAVSHRGTPPPLCLPGKLSGGCHQFDDLLNSGPAPVFRLNLALSNPVRLSKSGLNRGRPYPG